LDESTIVVKSMPWYRRLWEQFIRRIVR
jgi:hypothetical protein